jgi:hypothetical protein
LTDGRRSYAKIGSGLPEIAAISDSNKRLDTAEGTAGFRVIKFLHAQNFKRPCAVDLPGQLQ